MEVVGFFMTLQQEWLEATSSNWLKTITLEDRKRTSARILVSRCTMLAASIIARALYAAMNNTRNPGLARCVGIIATVLGSVARLPAQEPANRAILISFDGFSEQRLRQFTDSTSAPAFWSLLRDGACAESTRPAFPSVTPTGHAAIWTGAYGNVNGITSQRTGKLPLGATTILETMDGFGAAALNAEPLWITAARQGRSVFAHSVTQAPQPPGYPDVAAPSPVSARRRSKAAQVLDQANLRVVNGYNRLIAPASVVTETTSVPRAAVGWHGLDRVGAHGVPLREISWPFADDSLHALIYGAAAYTTMIIAPVRDVARGVIVSAAPIDTTPPRMRPLARYFSEPLPLDVPGGRTFVFARIFELAPDLSQFVLFVSEARLIEANRDVAGDYNAAVAGFVGNGGGRLRERGLLGPNLHQGGDGTAEWRYLETVELLTRQFMRGSNWAWSTFQPDLLIDYFPLPDEALHTWLGYADPATPGIAADVRARTSAFLTRAYALIDLRLAALRAFADHDGRTLLVVTGEHGMRPTWLTFRPNVVLRNAGLATVDSTGAIDLARTRAAAPNANFISVNRTSRSKGIVPPDSVEAVLRAVENVLRAARDSTGTPIVTQIWRSIGSAADSLGIGGPAGGDLYFGLAPGVYMSAQTQGPVLGQTEPRGSHGFPSIDVDMQPALCAVGPAVRPRRFGGVRSIDIAPTVAEWLGINAPADARGVSVLRGVPLVDDRLGHAPRAIRHEGADYGRD